MQKNKNKLFVYLRHKWAWPKQLAKIASKDIFCYGRNFFPNCQKCVQQVFATLGKKFYARSVCIEPAPGQHWQAVPHSLTKSTICLQIGFYPTHARVTKFLIVIVIFNCNLLCAMSHLPVRSPFIALSLTLSCCILLM